MDRELRKIGFGNEGTISLSHVEHMVAKQIELYFQ